MEVVTVVKLRLSPNKETARILDGQSKISNWLYNHLLERANHLREEYKKSQLQEVGKTLYTKRGLRDLIPELKKKHPFLKTVHSSPLKNAGLRIADTIQTYQKSRKGKRKGKVTGWPKFRSWKANWFSLYYDEPNKGFRLEDKYLKISLGMGEKRKRISISIPIQESHALKGKKIRNLRIVKKSNVFSAIFTVITKVPKNKSIKKVIALDPNHQNLSYGVDNQGNSIEIEAPYWLKIYDKRIDEIKSKRDRCKKKSKLIDILDKDGKKTGRRRWKTSRRWQRFDATLQRLLAKRREQTKAYLFTIANKLFKEYDLVAIGDYVPHGGGITTKMRRAMNNRSLIGRFKEVLSWVALRSGKSYDDYKEKGTTRTCHDCKHVVKDGIPPNQRAWKCPNCHKDHIRDENAARNGLALVLREWAKKENTSFTVPGSGLVFVRERREWRVRTSGIASIPRGKDGSPLQTPRN